MIRSFVSSLSERSILDHLCVNDFLSRSAIDFIETLWIALMANAHMLDFSVKALHLYLVSDVVFMWQDPIPSPPFALDVTRFRIGPRVLATGSRV